jgi:hypothetical protein
LVITFRVPPDFWLELGLVFARPASDKPLLLLLLLLVLVLPLLLDPQAATAIAHPAVMSGMSARLIRRI